MRKDITEVFCGNGRGKTAMAIGQSLRAATQGKSVIIVQFLKGRERRALDFLEDLDGLDIKIFRFDKYARCYQDLDEMERAEENRNIMNAWNFAHKVIVTGGCDFLVLDEILGLFDYGILPVETLTEVLGKAHDMHIVMTGQKLPEELCSHVDCVTTLTLEEMKSINITEE